jgi:hypothetical protein
VKFILIFTVCVDEIFFDQTEFIFSRRNSWRSERALGYLNSSNTSFFFSDVSLACHITFFLSWTAVGHLHYKTLNPSAIIVLTARVWTFRRHVLSERNVKHNDFFITLEQRNVERKRNFLRSNIIFAKISRFARTKRET